MHAVQGRLIIYRIMASQEKGPPQYYIPDAAYTHSKIGIINIKTVFYSRWDMRSFCSKGKKNPCFQSLNPPYFSTQP